MYLHIHSVVNYVKKKPERYNANMSINTKQLKISKVNEFVKIMNNEISVKNTAVILFQISLHKTSNILLILIYKASLECIQN